MKAYRRLTALPFESGIAALVLVAGVFGLVGIGRQTPDPLTLLIPPWLATATLITYALSGLCILIGLAKPQPQVEAMGLVGLTVSVLARALALVALVGFRADVMTALFFNLFVVWMCYSRVRTLIRGRP